MKRSMSDFGTTRRAGGEDEGSGREGSVRDSCRCASVSAEDITTDGSDGGCSSGGTNLGGRAGRAGRVARLLREFTARISASRVDGDGGVAGAGDVVAGVVGHGASTGATAP